MVYFQTRNPNLGKFGSALKWKMLVYLMAIGNILWPIGIIHGIWVILVFFPRFGTLCHLKSGNRDYVQLNNNTCPGCM
jgi:hypothetical protein